MRSRGQNTVVLIHVHFQHFRAGGLPHRGHRLYRFRMGLGRRGQYHFVVNVELWIAGFDAVFFRTGNRVAEHKVARNFTEYFFRGIAEIALHTGNIGDHRLRCNHGL